MIEDQRIAQVGKEGRGRRSTSARLRRDRLLLVSHETTLSGAPIELVHLAGWLNSRGWKIAIVAPEDGPVLDRTCLPGVELIFEPQLLIDPTYSALRRLARDSDLVLANTIATWEAVQAAHLEQKPVVWYLHETNVGVVLMKEIHMIQPSLGLASALIVPTRATARIYQHFTKRPMQVVPYGIPELPQRPTLSHDPRTTFVTTATYESRKGQDILLEAVQQVDSETRARARFQLAGRPLEAAFHDQLRIQAEAFENVELLGPLDHEQSIELLRHADVVVCPSRDETMPIFLLEGMSLGKALISTDVGGVTEWLQDGLNALIVPPQDPTALSAAIARCITDRELRDKLAAAARKTFTSHFTLERFGQHIEAILQETIESRENPGPPGTYAEWLSLYETPRHAQRVALRHAVERIEERPLISVLLPVYNPDLAWLGEAIDSVHCQINENWELCIADDASTDPRVRTFLEGKAASDARIKVTFRVDNGHISACSNSALMLATGEWCALLDQDDTLAEHALALVACEISEHPDAGLIYSDEDKIDTTGVRSNPFFKTDWNPELFLAQNYINHLGCYRTSLLRRIGGFREGLEGSQDYDLALRCVEHLQPHQVRHIPRVLYHWRMVPGSLAEVRDAKPYAKDAARIALNDHLRRSGIAGRSEPCPENIESHRVIYDLPETWPSISVIITAGSERSRLIQSVENLRPNLNSRDKIIAVIDDGANDLGSLKSRGLTVLREHFAGNRGRMHNVAAAGATTEILLFLDAGIEATGKEWLRELISQISRPEVGVVGARLWSADGILLHGGYVLGLCGIATPVHAGIPRGHPGFFNRAFLQRNCTAVSAACFAVRTQLFRELCGFDQEHLAQSFQDLDFCLRVWERGLQVVWTPYADLVLHGSDETGPATGPDADYIRRRWDERLKEDSFYSPNLSLASPVFELAFPPRWLHAGK